MGLGVISPNIANMCTQITCATDASGESCAQRNNAMQHRRNPSTATGGYGERGGATLRDNFV